MKRIINLLVLFSLLAIVVQGQNVPKKPVLQRLVNDYTNTLTNDQKGTLERKLVAYDDSTSNQVVVVIVPTLEDYAPVDYATKLGREWGVGNVKTNNGVILLVSMEPKNRQIFIAPGYGLEGAIPDITAKSIIEDVILPQFKQDHYFTGLDLGTTALMRAAAGEYKAPAGYRKRGKGSGGGSILGAIIFLFVMLMLFSRGGGGRGGGMVSRRGFGDVATGMLLGSLLSGGRGGGGGGGFGGGSGGGSFGGFGGGSFGGGGAGGSW